MTPSGYKLAAISSIPAARCQYVENRYLIYVVVVENVYAMTTRTVQRTKGARLAGWGRGWLAGWLDCWILRCDNRLNLRMRPLSFLFLSFFFPLYLGQASFEQEVLFQFSRGFALKLITKRRCRTVSNKHIDLFFFHHHHAGRGR